MTDFIDLVFSQRWTIALFILACLTIWITLSALLYKPFFKRFYDILLSGIALIVLSPILLILIIVGAIKMGGNPFFAQLRPGKNEKIFKMLKFRTMTNKRDENGNLLPDSERLTKYGKFLRSTSLDELMGLVSIFVGSMSIVGPRPLLVSYLPLYNEEQKKRHFVRPGLTGLAQIGGRNAISWEQKFEKDNEYIAQISLFGDIKIILMTVLKIIKREGISQEGEATMEFFMGNEPIEDNIKKNVLILSCGRRVELTKIFKQECGMLGGRVVCADMSETAPALQFADKTYVLPHCASESYIDELKKLCIAEKIDLIIPTIDTELPILAKYKSEIEGATEAKVMVSSQDVIEICYSKDMTAKFFKENAIDCPKTLSDAEIENNVEFPLFIKPKNGSSSIDTFKVKNKNELDFFMNYIKEPVVQECVEGKEYTIDILCDFENEPIYIVPRLRIATRGGEVLKGKIEKNNKIIEQCIDLIDKLKPLGHITAQGFLTSDNKFKFIEINARFGGGAPMSIYAGANSPKAILQLLNGIDVQRDNNYTDGMIFARFDDSVKVASL